MNNAIKQILSTGSDYFEVRMLCDNPLAPPPPLFAETEYGRKFFKSMQEHYAQRAAMEEERKRNLIGC